MEKDPIPRKAPQKTVRAVNRALDLLDILSESQDGLNLSRICDITDLNSSTAHRLLSTLSLRGYVRQEANTKKYYLGPKNLHLGQAALSQIDLGKLSIDHLRNLSKQVSELVNLAALADSHAIYIAQVPAEHRAVQMFTQLGARVPLHCTAVGKVMLAYLADEESERLLGSCPVDAYTANTITNSLRMKEELTRIRNSGYGLDEEEREIGVRCIAAPVFQAGGKVMAAISISGPPARLTPDRDQELSDFVIATADEISILLGYEREPS